VQWPSYGLDTTPKEQAPNKERWKSAEDQIKEREKRVKEISTFFDDAEAYAKAKTQSAAGSFRVVPAWESMLTVLRGEEAVVLHADESQQIQAAVEWARQRKYKVVLAGGRDAWRVASFLATNAIPVAYGHVFTSPPRDVDPYDVQFAAAGVLSRAGVAVTFSGAGERFGASNVRNTPYAAAQSVAYGMPRDAALKALTLEPAKLLGVSDRLGSLEVGKDATLFIADGDILDIRSKVVRMWIAGGEVPLESKHTRLYQRYKERPKR
jgi:imidazolonepropionase-like amidohydrolase